MKAISIALFLSLAASAAAATFTVDNTFDPGSGTCDAAGCTLREAIEAANASPGGDMIAFNIPGAGVRTITPGSPLPAITESVTIDGYTQPGASANTLAIGSNAVLLIELNGTSAGASHGLILDSDDSVVRGLVINRFVSVGLAIGVLAPGSNNLVDGNFIGTDADGTTALGNAEAEVGIFNGNSNLIGGILPSARNLISGQTFSPGVIVTNPAHSNSIQGNYIGTDRSGTTDLPNASGIVIVDSISNFIGGAEAGAGNLISGNSFNGVELLGAVAGSSVQGNLIGTNATGVSPLPNLIRGVFVEGSGSQIGGTEAGTRNVISANGVNGVLLTNGAAGNSVLGNFIGTDMTGTLGLRNGSNGVAITAASDNTVGDTTAGARNIISANQVGVLIDDGSTDNVVQGNFIGTDASGTVDLGPGDIEGVKIDHADDNLIGGSVPGAGNLVSGNSVGIRIGLLAKSNSIQGNLIGTDVTGSGPLPNNAGILLFDSVTDTTIGGPVGAGNTIAFNGGGVAIDSSCSGNQIYGNSIFRNVGLGINLSGGVENPDGVTANDIDDSDTGANELQNYPVLSEISVSGGDRSVQGSLTSHPNSDYVLNFYSNSEVDASGFGEGETWLGSLDVHTNVQNTSEFSFPLGADTAGKFITATATDINGNTSEFSKASAVVPAIGRFLNISTRLRVQSGDKVLIGGFILTGATPAEVLLRAIGPSLEANGQPIEGRLANPTLELFQGNTLLASNDNWQESQKAAIEATGLAPLNTLESAIVRTLDPGAYTMVVRGVNDGTGIGLVEAYDLSAADGERFANISTRGLVETGNNVMIGGFILGSNAGMTIRVVLRAIGPSLTDLGVPDALQDPMLELFDANGVMIQANDNWKDSQQAEIEAAGLAPGDEHESTIVRDLAPGAYTAITRGVGETSGVGLVEAYDIQ